MADILRPEDLEDSGEKLVFKAHLNDENDDEDEDEAEDKSKEDPLMKKMMEYMIGSRTVMLFQQIEPKMTSKLIAQLLFLNDLDSKKEIKMFINSPGGVADDGLAIYDVIKLIDAPVKTIVCGIAASAAAIVLVAAKKQNRLALAHSRVMIHQPLGGVGGSAIDIEISTQQIIRLKHRLNEILADETGQPIDKVKEDTNRDYWFSTDEAMKYGMVAKMVKKLSDI